MHFRSIVRRVVVLRNFNTFVGVLIVVALTRANGSQGKPLTGSKGSFARSTPICTE
ncbi:UNVERIFIED_ORG: hypothetical protein M2193_001850 [Bradyrhizobium japonicum]